MGPRTPRFWAVCAVAQLVPFAAVDVSPWLLLPSLLVAGPVLHAAQVTFEHTVGSLAGPAAAGAGYTLANGVLVLAAVVSAPAVGWLLAHTSAAATVGVCVTAGAAVCALLAAASVPGRRRHRRCTDKCTLTA